MAIVNLRRLVLFAAIAVLAVLVFVTRDGGPDHTVSFVVPAAANLLPGNKVNGGGGNVGAVRDVVPVDHGRAARVTIRIEDDRYWPLPSDSTVELRLGGTVSFASRYLLIRKGEGAATLPNGGQLAARNVKTPVEVDTVVSAFTPQVRSGLRGLITNGAANSETGSGALRRAVAAAPPVVTAAPKLLGDLTKNQDQLAALVRSTERVVVGVDRSSPDVRVLLDGLGQTLDAVATKHAELQTTLTRLPAALRQTRTTLRIADVTLREAGDLTDSIAPGVVQLRRTARPLNALLLNLSDVAPGAERTLRAVQNSGITAQALSKVADVAPELKSIGKQATDELSCLRPYSPEIAGWFTDWADIISPVDNRDHMVRAVVQNFLPAPYNSVGETAEDLVKNNPGVEYGFPRVPGQNAGQPWFQPQCGAGKEAMDPSKDQESINYKANRFTLPPDLAALQSRASKESRP